MIQAEPPHSLPSRLASRAPSAVALLCVGAVAAAALWVYWDLLAFAAGSAPEVEPEIRGAERALFLPSETAPGIVFFALGLLLFDRLHALRGSLAEPGHPLLALPLLGLAAAAALWSQHVAAVDLLLVSLALMLLGAGYLLGGRSGLLLLLLPAAFLYFAWPAPRVFVNHLLLPMQLFAAEASAAVLEILGVPHLLIGDQIRTQRAVFLVIETCSGLRSVVTLSMAAVLYGQLFRCSHLRALLLLLAAPLIALGLNVVRVVTIILNPHSETIGVHTLQGLVVIAVGVCLIAALDLVLVRLLDSPHRHVPKVTAKPPIRPARWAGLAVFLAGLGAVGALLPVWTPPTGTRPPLFQSVPGVLGDWKGRTRRIDMQFLGALYFSDKVSRVYLRGEEEIELFVAEDDRLHPLRYTVVSPKTAFPGTGWRTEQTGSAELPALGITARTRRVRSLEGERLVYHWYANVEPLTVEVARAALALDRGPLRRQQPAILVQISTQIEAGRGSEAEARLRSFAALLASAPFFADPT